jgi:hypothetical protein
VFAQNAPTTKFNHIAIMLVVSKKQITELKVFAEANYKRILCQKKAAQHNSENEFTADEFNSRILKNFETAKYYGFKAKREIERFIDLAILHDELNKPVPLEDEVHRFLASRDKSGTQKLIFLSDFYSKKRTVK